MFVCGLPTQVYVCVRARGLCPQHRTLGRMPCYRTVSQDWLVGWVGGWVMAGSADCARVCCPTVSFIASDGVGRSGLEGSVVGCRAYVAVPRWGLIFSTCSDGEGGRGGLG